MTFLKNKKINSRKGQITFVNGTRKTPLEAFIHANVFNDLQKFVSDNIEIETGTGTYRHVENRIGLEEAAAQYRSMWHCNRFRDRFAINIYEF